MFPAAPAFHVQLTLRDVPGLRVNRRYRQLSSTGISVILISGGGRPCAVYTRIGTTGTAGAGGAEHAKGDGCSVAVLHNGCGDLLDAIGAEEGVLRTRE